MARIIKGRQMTARYYKGREVLKEYKQGRLVYEKSTSIPDYLCFTALEAGQFTLTIPAAVTATYLSYVEWSKDGRTWTHTDNTSEAMTIDVQVAQGDKVYWRGSGTRMSYSGNSGYTSGFSSTGAFSISGHLVSILKGSDFEDIDFLGATFARLFQDCSNLISAGELILPSFTTASVFSSLFLRCTALVSAPELPPVTNLTTGCYYQMFFGCSSLAYVKCLATNISATNCLQNWLYGASSTGTFIQASGVTWPRGASGIPTGWVDVEKRTMPSGYKQLLWVSTDSKAYVNTGIAGDNDNLKITTVFNMSAYVDWGAIYGNYVGDSYNVTRLVQGSSDACSCCNLNVKSNNSGNQFDYDVFHINIPHMVIQSKNSVIYNGTTKNISGKASGTANSGYIALGNRSMTNPNTTRNIGLCIYTHKIEDTSLSSVLCDYVACIRESDSKAGFYDFVSNAFIPSATSSDFTAGEEI